MTRALGMVAALLALAVAGCTAGFFLVGAQMHDAGAPASAGAIYTVPTCESLTGAAPVAGPAGYQYYLDLAAAPPSLYELDGAGNGARIVNHWVDAEGDHFFTYVKTSGAWHYVIPRDAAQPAMRYAYEANGAWSTAEEGGVIKPTGTASWKCPMIKK
jgi:hypothetical protein